MKKRALQALAVCLLSVLLLTGVGCADMDAFLYDILPSDISGRLPLELGEPLPAIAVERYGGTTLSGDEKYAYDQLVRGIYRTVPSQVISLEDAESLTEDELSRAVEIFASDYPECFWFEKSYRFASRKGKIMQILPDYSFADEALTEARAELDAAVQAILDGAPANADRQAMTLYLHDAVADAVTYEKVGYHQTAYGALVDGRAVCAGYAAAYQLLLNRAGIPAWTVIGTSVDRVAEAESGSGDTETTVLHAWNLVWLTDDACVYTDVTWDDAAGDAYTFHQYLNLSHAEIERDHTAKTELFTLPACNHTGYDYFDTRENAVLNERSTPSEVANSFCETTPGIFEASFRFESPNDAFAWFKSFDTALMTCLSPSAQTCSYTVRTMADEVYIRLEITQYQG